MEVFANQLELIELILRTICDTDPELPEIADATLLFGQTPDNEGTVIEAATQLFSAGKTKRIVFVETGILITGKRYHLDWEEQLRKLGVPAKSIVSLEISNSLAHTHTEAKKLILYAREKGWKIVYVTSHPLHQLRAFVNTVSIVLRDYPDLWVFSRTGRAESWLQEVVHSQTITKGRRAELIKGEWGRILRYNKKGDLVSAREVLNYLNRRDSRR